MTMTTQFLPHSKHLGFKERNGTIKHSKALKRDILQHGTADTVDT